MKLSRILLMVAAGALVGILIEWCLWRWGEWSSQSSPGPDAWIVPAPDAAPIPGTGGVL